MTGIIVRLVAATALIAFTVHADGQNAAELYQKAFVLFEAFSPEERSQIHDLTWLEGDPTPEQRELLRRADPIIELLGVASTLPKPEFGVEWEKGFDATLPHLARMRGMARLLAARARVEMRSGGEASAAELIAVSTRLSDHVTHDGGLIGSLVGSAMFSLSGSTLDAAIDEGRLTAEMAEKVLASTDSLSPDDAFGYGAALTHEAEVFGGWMRRESLNPEQFRAKMSEAGVDPGLLPEGEDLLTQIDAYERVMERSASAMSNPDPDAARAEIAKLEREVVDGVHGGIAQLLMPALDKLVTTKFRTQEQLAQRRAILEGVISGKLTVADTANAAVWYRRAFRAIEALPEAQRAAVFSAAGGTPSTESDTTLDEVGESVLGQMVSASQIKRCEFLKADDADQRPTLLLDHAAGMLEASGFLEAHVRRLLARGDDAAAVHFTSVLFRASAHLAADKTVVSSLVAHRLCERAADLKRDLLVRSITTEQKDVLASALATISVEDPFGYKAAGRAEMSSLEDRVHWLALGDAVRAEFLSEARTADLDRLLAIIAQIDRWRLDPGPSEDGTAKSVAPPPLISRLDEVLSVDEVSRAFQEDALARALLAAALRNPTEPAPPRTASLPPAPDVIIASATARQNLAADTLAAATAGLEDRMPALLLGPAPATSPSADEAKPAEVGNEGAPALPHRDG